MSISLIPVLENVFLCQVFIPPMRSTAWPLTYAFSRWSDSSKQCGIESIGYERFILQLTQFSLEVKDVGTWRMDYFIFTNFPSCSFLPFPQLCLACLSVLCHLTAVNWKSSSYNVEYILTVMHYLTILMCTKAFSEIKFTSDWQKEKRSIINNIVSSWGSACSYSWSELSWCT